MWLILWQSLGNNALDRTDKVPGLGLRDHFGDSCFARGFGQGRQVENRKQEQRYIRIDRRHGCSGLQAVHIRHSEVDEHKIWLQFIEFSNAFAARNSFTAHRPFA